MALSTPINLTNRGLTANAGVTTSLYPHSQQGVESPVRVKSVRFSGPDATVVKGAAIAVSDAFPLITIPAGAFVLSVTHKVVTAEGGTFTYSIGDTTTAAGFVSGANGNTTTNASSFNATTTPTYGVGKYYAAANTIDLTVASGTAATAVVDISVIYIDTTARVI